MGIILICLLGIGAFIWLCYWANKEDPSPKDVPPRKVNDSTTSPSPSKPNDTTQEPWTWTVYVHIAPNGRAYVGQTRQKPVSKRWGKTGNCYKKNAEFWADICYYGWDNFEHIILRENIPTWKSCQRSEKYYIKKYNALTEGYNKHPGGRNKKYC